MSSNQTLLNKFVIKNHTESKGKVKSADLAGAYPGFCSMTEATRSISIPPWMGCMVHCRVTLNITFPSTHSYTWVERETQRKV